MDIQATFGVDYEEEFKLMENTRIINVRPNIYKFSSRRGLVCQMDGVWYEDTKALQDIITGKLIIKKMPWKPKIGESYYVPTIDLHRGTSSFELYTCTCSQKVNSILCKTADEAIALGKYLLKAAKDWEEQV